ncbi:MAG: hypothetical protein DWQ58_14940 [Microcystis aeruginosa TA09]|nr:MAG: hypothetical protein DWQ58_14940 [Microcystis aeruginosa TA09]
MIFHVEVGFFKGNSLPKLVVICDFITQSWLLGGRTLQTPPHINFSVRCLHAVVIHLYQFKSD